MEAVKFYITHDARTPDGPGGFVKVLAVAGGWEGPPIEFDYDVETRQIVELSDVGDIEAGTHWFTEFNVPVTFKATDEDVHWQIKRVWRNTSANMQKGLMAALPNAGLTGTSFSATGSELTQPTPPRPKGNG